MKQIYYFLIFLPLLSIFSISAIELNIDEKFTRENVITSEDYLFAGDSLEFTGEANDLYVLADNIYFSGKTRLSVITAAEQVEVAGTVGNGVKAVGQYIRLKGDITGTSFLAGEKITLDSDSRINSCINLSTKKTEKSEHTKNKRKSTKNKHQKGQKRKDQKNTDKKRKKKGWY